MAVIFGITGSIHGVPVFTGHVAQTATFDYKPRIMETVEDEQGILRTRYYDDIESRCTVEVIVTSASLAISSSKQLVTSKIPYNGQNWIVEDVKNAQKNKGFMTGNFDMVTSDGISI